MRAVDDETLPEDWEERDSIASYYEAIAAIGEAVRAGRELPAWFVSCRKPPR